MNINKTSASYFEKMYQDQVDPWKFASNNYELKRYQRIYQALKHKHYQSIFEPGCSIGVLTAMLSNLGSQIDAIDISSTAIERARTRCSHLKNIHIHCQSLQDYRLEKKTDLIILSEIGYYFETNHWEKIIFQLINNCANDAIILASHWLGCSENHLISGQKVHEIIHAQTQLEPEYNEKHKDFHLDRWRKKC